MKTSHIAYFWKRPPPLSLPVPEASRGRPRRDQRPPAYPGDSPPSVGRSGGGRTGNTRICVPAVRRGRGWADLGRRGRGGEAAVVVVFSGCSFPSSRRRLGRRRLAAPFLCWRSLRRRWGLRGRCWRRGFQILKVAFGVVRRRWCQGDGFVLVDGQLHLLHQDPGG